MKLHSALVPLAGLVLVALLPGRVFAQDQCALSPGVDASCTAGDGGTNPGPCSGFEQTEIDAQDAVISGRDYDAAIFRFVDLSGLQATPQVCPEGPDEVATNLEGADLRNAILRDADFSSTPAEPPGPQTLRVRLSGASLDFSDAIGADFRFADFSDSSGSPASLLNAELRGAIFDGALFSGTFIDDSTPVMPGALLQNVDATCTTFEDGMADLCASFVGADLSYAEAPFADFEGAVLTNANFTGADLTGARFRGLTFGVGRAEDPWDPCEQPQESGCANDGSQGCVNFDGATLDAANFEQVDFSRFWNASWQGISMVGASLRGSSLAECSFANVDSMARVDLSSIENDLTDLVGARLTGTDSERFDLQGADLDGATLAEVRESVGARADLRFADLSDATLSRGSGLSSPCYTDGEGDAAVTRCVILDGARLHGARMRGVDFTELAAGEPLESETELEPFDFQRLAASPDPGLSGPDLASADLVAAIVSSADYVADLRNADLREALLRSADLTSADLGGAALDDADFAGATLVGTRFDMARFRNTDLSNVVLCDSGAEDPSPADFSGATFEDGLFPGQRTSFASVDFRCPSQSDLEVDDPPLDTDFFGLTLAGLDLTEATLSGKDLTGQDLSDALLVEADLSGTSFGDAILKGTDLTGATLHGADLSLAQLVVTEMQDVFVTRLDDASLCSSGDTPSCAVLPSASAAPDFFEETRLRRWDFQGYAGKVGGAPFSGRSFDGADLQGAIFVSVALEGASFVSAILEGADFTGAELASVDLTDAFLRDADLEGALLCSGEGPGCAIFDSSPGADPGGARLRGASLREQDFVMWANDFGFDFTGDLLARVARNQGAPDLREVNLERADLRGFDFDFDDSALCGAVSDATAPNLAGALLSGARLGDRLDDQGESVVSESLLCHVVFDNVTGSETDFSGADLSQASIRDANLSSANLSGVVLIGVRGERTDFSSADLRDARLGGVAGSPELGFTDASFSGATFCSLDSDSDPTACADLGETTDPLQLRGVNFDGVSLSHFDQLNGSGYFIDRVARTSRPGGEGTTTFADLRGASFEGGSFVGMRLSLDAPAGVDLSDANLKGADLSGSTETRVDLRRAILDRIEGGCVDESGSDCADWSFADLRDASLRLARLQQSDLSSALLSGADLSDAFLDGATLDGTNLDGATLRRALLRCVNQDDDCVSADNASFVMAVLQGANLTRADLEDAVFSSADLTEAALVAADLERVSLSGATLTMADLRSADLTDAMLNDATMSEATLAGALLTRSTLLRATLTMADLTGADLRDAIAGDEAMVMSADPAAKTDLSEAILDSALMESAVFDGAIMDGVRVRCGSRGDGTCARAEGASFIAVSLVDGDLSGADLRMTDFEGATLDDATLDGANLAGALLTDARAQGARLPRSDLGNAQLCATDLQAADFAPGASVDADGFCTDVEEGDRVDLRGANLKGALLAQALHFNEGCIRVDEGTIYDASTTFPADFSGALLDTMTRDDGDTFECGVAQASAIPEPGPVVSQLAVLLALLGLARLRR